MTPENSKTFSTPPTLSPEELELEFDLDLDGTTPEILVESINDSNHENGIDPSLLNKISHSHHANHFGAVAMATTLAIALPYSYDVGINRLKETYDEPRIKILVDTPEGISDSGSFTYNINGIDTSNADEMTIDLAPAFQQVSPDRMKSIDFENARLKINTLANKIMVDALKAGKEKISLVGNSTGGIIVLMVALEIIKKSDLKIETIYLYETPDGFDGLKAGSKKDLAMLMDTVANFPGSEDSNYIRDILTVATEKSSYTHGDTMFEDLVNMDWKAFFEVFGESIDKTRNQERPRMDTLIKQGFILANANPEAIIKEIGELRGKKYMPTVVTIMSDPQKATVVDTLKSTKQIKEYLYEADINTFSIVVDSKTQRHTSYNFDVESNARGVAPRVDEIKASHAESELELAVNNEHFFQEDTIAHNKG